MAYNYNYTSNRGVSGYPQNYFSGVQQGGQPAGGGSSWNQPAPDAVAQWAQYAQAQQQPQQSSLYNLLGGLPTSIYDFGGGAQQTPIRQGVPGGGRQLRGGYNLPRRASTGRQVPSMGGGGGGGGQAPGSGGGGIPPATTQPMTPVGGGGAGSGIGTYTNPITAGQLSNDAIAKAMATINAGAPQWAVAKYGGAFGDNLTQDLERAGINLSRAASEQQASMDLAQQRARAGAGLDMAGLLQQLNAQNVTSQLNNEDAIFRMMTNLFGGLGGMF